VFQYTVRRLVIAAVTLVGVTMIVFAIIAMMPGDPAAIQSDVQDPEMSARMYEMLRKHFGLDKPLHERYVIWLGKLVQGDFGTSFADGRPVMDKILERLMATMSVATLSVFIGLACAIPIGLLQAVKQGGWFDNVSGVLLYAAFAVPSYVGAVVLVYYVGVKWDMLPFRGMTSDEFEQLSFLGKTKDLIAHYVLITFCFTYQSLAFDARFVRGTMLEVLRQDYIRTARAKGVDERWVILKHAFRNTFIPLLTRLGFLLPVLISGSVILEVIFNWPGLGSLFFQAILMRDYPVMMASLVITSVLVLVGILLSDLCYALADPRITYD
jgi:peptide/nickel transport system permease protein